MIPWLQLGSAQVPGGAGELRLMKRGAEFSIMLGTNELMNSRVSGSEQALAELACGKIRDRKGIRILIGGLGMGFTLRAALAILPDEASITVAELVPEVLAWAHGPLAPVFSGSLQDHRVELCEADVGALIASGRKLFDAILLDVDNGPEGLTREFNDNLYSATGVRTAHAALKPGGVLAIWSAGQSADFTRRLERSGFVVEQFSPRARGTRRGARHTIWVATKSSGVT